MGLRPHYNLEAWKQAMVLAQTIYVRTNIFPKDELYGLTSQMRRSAVSIPSNIAEGAARNSSKEFLQFIGIARGSLSELETQVLLAHEIGYLENDDDIIDCIDSVARLLSGLHQHLAKK